MDMIPTSRTRTFIVPNPAPIPALVIKTRHVIRVVYSHLPGISKGSLIYSDLNGYGWYDGSAGFETRPGPGISINRYMRGLEDIDERRVQ